MKKLIVILMSVFFVSCDNIVILNDKSKPFIVKTIDKCSPDGYSAYYSEYSLLCDQILVLPTGMYNIGDTIQINRTATFSVSFIEDSLGTQKTYKYSGFPKDMDEAIQKLIDKKR